MTGYTWLIPEEGGYLYSPELSKRMRMQMQAQCKFRQFCDATDAQEFGAGRGEKFYWDVAEDVKEQGWDLEETSPMPETNGEFRQRFLTVGEAGNSIPFSKKLSVLAARDVERIVDQQLRRDAVKYFDAKAFLEFKKTPLRVAPTGGTSTSSVTLTTNGATGTTNNVELRKDHIKAISDLMKTRNIPAFDNDNYYAISNIATLRPFKNDLEALKVYTESGMSRIMSGEIGRYEDVRFIEQNNIPEGGANDSTTFSARTRTPDPWNNGKSSWAFFFGADTVMEAIVESEQIRAKLAGDYGRSRGIGWYYLGGFGLVNPEPLHARIVMWDSAA